GQTVDEAVWWFITMDRSCHTQLLALAAGKPALIMRESALATRQLVGTHQAGWFQFQPLWDMITREQPDLLD
ncbi:MAG TPA: class II aldolase/adducin family protein, partial [Terriglobales bacterium]